MKSVLSCFFFFFGKGTGCVFRNLSEKEISSLMNFCYRYSMWSSSVTREYIFIKLNCFFFPRQMNRHILTNLRPGTRYKIKLAPLMNSGKMKGVYTNWINARTLAGEKTNRGELPYKRTGVLMGNFTRTPKRYQDSVLWARLEFFFSPKRYQF